MNDLAGALERWRAAGLLTGDQAAAIAAFEQAPATAPTRSTTGAEAIGYVGGALALGAVGLLLGNVWSDLLIWGKVAILVLLTVALGGAGLALTSKSVPSIRRLSSVLLTATVGGVAWTAATVASDLLAWQDAAVATTVGGAATAVAVVFYAMRQRALLQLALVASVLVLVVSLVSHAQLPSRPVWYGLLVASVGAAWLIASRGGWLSPTIVADIAGSGLVLIGAQVATIDPRNVLTIGAGVVVAGLIVGVAVRADMLHLLVVGAIGVFVLLPQLVFEIFGDVVSAPAVLLIIGLLLVLLSVGLGRARHLIVDGRKASATLGGLL
ncbi:MAG: hypothetical protein WD007_02380 [Nitriliruptoraceae bacterium]